jgi:hypothetical protein
MRWLAAKLAIVRQAVRDGAVVLVKVPSDMLVPDIFTKSITDVGRFERLRDDLLGVPSGPRLPVFHFTNEKVTKAVRFSEGNNHGSAGPPNPPVHNRHEKPPTREKRA